MDKSKPLYVVSYIKDYVKEQTGVVPDQSVFEAIQNAILGVLQRGFDVTGKKAVLKSSPAEEEPEQVQNKELKLKKHPKFEHIDHMLGFEKLMGVPRSGVFGSGNNPAALVRIADDTILSVYSNVDITILDLDRLGRMCGNLVYDKHIFNMCEVLNALDANKVIDPADFDCAGFSKLMKKIHMETAHGK